MEKKLKIILERARDGVEPLEDLEQELLNLHSVTNCYSLNEGQKSKMREHKSNTVKFSHGSGIGVGVDILNEKGDWIDITDYSCW